MTSHEATFKNKQIEVLRVFWLLFTLCTKQNVKNFTERQTLKPETSDAVCLRHTDRCFWTKEIMHH